MDDPKLLRLDPQDNVLVARQRIETGDTLQVGAGQWKVATPIPLGFKVAARALSVGEKVIKYGAPIGSATAPIAAGETVHLHNMKSDYLPTFTRDEELKYGRA